jgi:hypothetical protein
MGVDIRKQAEALRRQIAIASRSFSQPAENCPIPPNLFRALCGNPA